MKQPLLAAKGSASRRGASPTRWHQKLALSEAPKESVASVSSAAFFCPGSFLARTLRCFLGSPSYLVVRRKRYDGEHILVQLVARHGQIHNALEEEHASF